MTGDVSTFGSLDAQVGQRIFAYDSSLRPETRNILRKVHTEQAASIHVRRQEVAVS